MPRKRYAHKPDERRTNKSRRLIGVEVEVNSNDDDASSLWEFCEDERVSVVEDGSLNSGGYELNTVPAAGDHFISHIKRLGTHLCRAGAEVNGDCGLHVHIDASDFRFYDMRRLVMLYAKLEPALFGMMPESRRTSSFCQPCGAQYVAGLDTTRQSKASKAALIDNVYDVEDGGSYKGAEFARMRVTKWGSARYRALNLHSWIFRGTVECRLHTGTVNPQKIIAWGMLWAAILDFAMARTEKDIAALKVTTLDDSAALLMLIAPTADVQSYVRERLAKHSDMEVA